MEGIQKLSIELEGLVPIMFNRFIDHSKEERPPEQKLYLDENNTVVLPMDNLMSFLCGWYVPGCIKKFEKKGATEYIDVAYSHISFDPPLIPFIRNNKAIKFKGFKDSNTWGIFNGAGVTKSSGGAIIKQPAQPRPYLKPPWSLAFMITLVKNNLIDDTKLYNYWTQGGILVALGTHRPMYGRFLVKKWEEQ